MPARVSQSAVEVLELSDPNIQVSQSVIEIVVFPATPTPPATMRRELPGGGSICYEPLAGSPKPKVIEKRPSSPAIRRKKLLQASFRR